MIVVDCEPNCKSYHEKIEEILDMLSRAVLICPICRHALVLHSRYDRQVIEGDGNVEHISVYVAKCERCGKFQSLLPSFVMPYKHYSGNVIEAVLNHAEGADSKKSICPADDSTMRRWKKQFQERGNAAVGWLQSLAWELCQKALSIIILQGLSILRQIERLLWEIDGKSTSSVSIIGRANRYLTAYGKGYI
jgi:hypothetical protein